jgi:subtilisin family serine protease
LLLVLSVFGTMLYRAPTGKYPTVSEPENVWVMFTDKGFTSLAQADLVLNRLSAGLSEKAVERRVQVLGQAVDFDDVPPFERYVALVEELGGQLRTKSAWLNAASFRMAPEVMVRVAALPFVHEVRQVARAWEPTNEELFALSAGSDNERHRGEDTTGWKDIYGLAYSQAKMLGVPQVYLMGITGANARIGLLDTGLKRKHPAVKGINVVGEHDFLGGDRFMVGRAGDSAGVAPASGFEQIGLMEDPVVFRSGETVYVCYIADSSLYDSPARALFGIVSFDNGLTWGLPQTLFPPELSKPSLHRPTVCGKGGLVYVAWTVANRSEDNVQVWDGHFAGGAWTGGRMTQVGKSPCLFQKGDSLYLASLGPDSTLWFNSASIAGGGAVWGPGDPKVEFTELVRDPSVVVDDAGHIYMMATGWRSGKVHLYRSDNNGDSFDEVSSPVAAKAELARLTYAADGFRLWYKDYSASPLVGLSVQSSGDMMQWTKQAIVESLPALGSYDVRAAGQELKVVFEREGVPEVRASADGVNWSNPGRVGWSEFARAPRWLDADRVIWIENGDDSTDIQARDSLRFGHNQADHGTRMASIIAGFRKGSMVGVAPGTEFLIAKTEFHSFRRPNIGYEILLEEDNYIAGLEWAERHGADIISSSLGYTSWYRPEDFDGKTAPISVAAGKAAERGLVVVTAMGNRDTTAPEKRWPNPYIVAPGDARGVITVGGIEKNLTPWHTLGGGGTGCGPTADGRTKPDIVAMGDSVTVVAPDSTGNVYEGSSGTSGATALIAGSCALLKQAHPEWSGPQIRDTLLRYSSRSSAPDDTFGHGVPNVYAILKNNPPTIKTYKNDDLGAIFPNPWAAGERVYFPIILQQPASFASISIFTLGGELVDTISVKSPRRPETEKYLSAPGNYTSREQLEEIGAWWDGRNAAGRPVAAGMYYAVLQTGYSRAVRQFAMVR